MTSYPGCCYTLYRTESRRRRNVRCATCQLPDSDVPAGPRPARDARLHWPAPMPPAVAVITLAFDPVVRLDGFAVRLRDGGGRRRRAADAAHRGARGSPRPGRPVTWTRGWRPGSDRAAAEHLRRDDLLFVVLGSIPGAVIGARLGAVLVHLDFFAANPGAIVVPVDRIAAAVAGRGRRRAGWRDHRRAAGHADGAVAACRGAAAPGRASAWARRRASWAHPAWARRRTCHGRSRTPAPGPWATLGPDIRVHPSQVYEGLGALGVLLIVLVLARGRGVQGRDGRAFFVALGPVGGGPVPRGVHLAGRDGAGAHPRTSCCPARARFSHRRLRRRPPAPAPVRPRRGGPRRRGLAGLARSGDPPTV